MLQKASDTNPGSISSTCEGHAHGRDWGEAVYRNQGRLPSRALSTLMHWARSPAASTRNGARSIRAQFRPRSCAARSRTRSEAGKLLSTRPSQKWLKQYGSPASWRAYTAHGKGSGTVGIRARSGLARAFYGGARV